MRQDYGRVIICAILGILAAALAVPLVDESQAEAGTLRNSVRVGDRTKMHIARVPGAGEARLPLPDATTRVLGPDVGARPEEGLGVKGGLRRVGPQDWFWALHTPSRRAANPRRWARALETLRSRRARGESIVATRLIEAIVRRHGPVIEAAADRHTLSASLIAAVIAIESAGRVQARSHAGAQGLMQLMPQTAARFGVTDSYDPRANIFGGAAYLSWLLRRFEHDPILALAGYNAGEGAVDKHDGVPPFRETRDYVVKVFDALAAAEGLCLSRPETPRHPCDWRVATAH